MLVLGLYFREQRFILYTVITAGIAVEVSSGTVGRVVMVKLRSATGRAASCQLAAAR